MPLTALLNGNPIIGPLCDDETWQRCRRAAKNEPETLLLRSSGKQCYPRTSRRGLRHFAHRRGEGTSAPESMQHLLLKAAVARTLQNHGWEVDVESPAPDRTWIADVLAINPSGRLVAWEIQVSPQPEEEFRRRTQRYSDDEVYTVWITPHVAAIPPNTDAIALNRKDVWQLSSLEDASQVPTSLLRNQHCVEPQIPLSKLMGDVLEGRTVHASPLLTTILYQVECWSCGTMVTAWTRFGELRAAGPDGRRMPVEPWSMRPALPDSPRRQRHLAEAVARHGLSPLLNVTYTADNAKGSSHCPQCLAPWRDRLFAEACDPYVSPDALLVIFDEPATRDTDWGWSPIPTPPTVPLHGPVAGQLFARANDWLFYPNTELYRRWDQVIPGEPPPAGWRSELPGPP